MLGRLRFVSLDHNGSLTIGSNQKFCGQHQIVWISIAVYWEREYVAVSELTSKVACWKVLQACPKKMTMTIRPYTCTDQISDWCSWYESKYFATRPYAHLMADCKHYGSFHLIDWIIGDLSNLRRSIHFWCNTPRHLERLCFSSYVSSSNLLNDSWLRATCISSVEIGYSNSSPCTYTPSFLAGIHSRSH